MDYFAHYRGSCLGELLFSCRSNYSEGDYLTLSFFSQKNRISRSTVSLIILGENVFFSDTRTTFVGRRIYTVTTPLGRNFRNHRSGNTINVLTLFYQYSPLVSNRFASMLGSISADNVRLHLLVAQYQYLQNTSYHRHHSGNISNLWMPDEPRQVAR